MRCIHTMTKRGGAAPPHVISLPFVVLFFADILDENGPIAGTEGIVEM